MTAFRLEREEFRALQELVYREAGIHLADSKRALVLGRLTPRLRELGIESFRAYLDHVEGAGGASERVRMLDQICTNETSFFREPRHFELLQDTMLPKLRASIAEGRHPARVRAWSAACSSGEEPYTLAAVLLEAFPPESGVHVEILATDLSTKILERAERAVYPIEKAREIPRRLLRRFFLRGTRSAEGTLRPDRPLRDAVTFRRLNLHVRPWPMESGFDFIFCRNVLIYFDLASKKPVIDTFARLLAPGGLLFLGHAENLGGLSDKYASVAPTVYTPIHERVRAA